MYIAGHICIYPRNRPLCVSSFCLPVLYFILIIPVGDCTYFTNRVLREDNFDTTKALYGFYVLSKDVACTCRQVCGRNCVVVCGNYVEEF